jgi:hypothetical protein
VVAREDRNDIGQYAGEKLPREETKMWNRLISSLALMSFLLVLHVHAISADPRPVDPKPYRVLIIIGDQWDDPGSYAIDARSRFGNRSRESAKDFLDVMTMLKIWGIPFDILRLDQQRPQINRFLNGIGGPN